MNQYSKPHNLLFASSLIALGILNITSQDALSQENRPHDEKKVEQATTSESNTTQGNTQISTSLNQLKKQISFFKLSNGIRVVLAKRQVAPIFTGQIWVKVGGVNEDPGFTGLAHLLEHMAFKGTKTIGEKISNEFSRIYTVNGGVGLNAGTAQDYTYYTISLPSNNLELWCWMESERLLNPVFRQFKEELQVVMEERRMRVDDDPEGKLYELLLDTAFTAHPYKHPTIGYKKDLAKLTEEKLKEFYQKYYQPENMVISIAGDIDEGDLKFLLEKYFSRIKSTGSLPEPITVVEPEQQKQKTAKLVHQSEPSMFIAYHKPTYPHKDDVAFTLLHALLDGGRSSIMQKKLILEKQVATSIDTGEAPGSLYPPLFYIFGSPAKSSSVFKLKEEIEKILIEIRDKGISEEDLNSAKKQVQMTYLSSLDSSEDLAKNLGETELLYGDHGVIFEYYKSIQLVTASEIQEVIKKYLSPTQQTFVYIEKPQQN